MRTRRRPGRVGTRGEGRGAPGNGPRPRPAFERATQGARRRFKSKRPAARPPSLAQAGWRGKGALRDPARLEGRGRREGRRGARPRGRLGSWVGGEARQDQGRYSVVPSHRREEPDAQTACVRPQGPDSKPCSLGSEPGLTPLGPVTHSGQACTGPGDHTSSRSGERGAPRYSSKEWWCSEFGLGSWRTSWRKRHLSWGLAGQVARAGAQELKELGCVGWPREVGEG